MRVLAVSVWNNYTCASGCSGVLLIQNKSTLFIPCAENYTLISISQISIYPLVMN